jgi:hypothetical protein
MDPSSSTSRSYLKTETQMRETVPFPIIETGSTKSNLKTKPKLKRIIGSLPVFKSETDISPMPTQYIQNGFRRNVSFDPMFSVNEMIMTVL